jgi:hypothetical protein
MKTPEWTIADIPPETGKIAVVTGRTAGLAGIRSGAGAGGRSSDSGSPDGDEEAGCRGADSA